MKIAIWAVWIISILFISNLICLYFIFQCRYGQNHSKFTDQDLTHKHSAGSSFFKQRIEESKAIRWVKSFNLDTSLHSRGVVYDPGTIRRYLDSNYLATIDSMDTRSHPDYAWKVGFYWMIKKGDDSIPRLSFCVLPTLVRKYDNLVIDYFNDTQNFYKHPALSPSLNIKQQVPPGGPGNSYDEGQLWP